MIMLCSTLYISWFKTFRMNCFREVLSLVNMEHALLKSFNDGVWRPNHHLKSCSQDENLKDIIILIKGTDIAEYLSGFSWDYLDNFPTNTFFNPFNFPNLIDYWP